jgi:hypothetical protein
MYNGLSSLRYLLPFLLLASACAVNRDFYGQPQATLPAIEDDNVIHTIYFLGQSDKVKLKESLLGQLLEEQMEISGKKSSLVLLGNNSLKTVAPGDSSKRAMEKRGLLERRYNFFNGLKGKYYSVLGPNEWSYGGTHGSENIRVLEEFVEDQLDQGNVILPSDGCPGPEEIEINNDLVLLLIDTQWLFHNWDKPREEAGCEASTDMDFYINLNDAILRNKDRQVILAGYHSLSGNGRHGGYFGASQHLIPLPILGSLRVFARSTIGTPEDLSSAKYKLFIRSMEEILKKHENLIYLSAHERTLEYHKKGHLHLLNSGSYSRGVEIGQKNAVFASGSIGYGRLIFTDDGACRLEYWGIKNDNIELLYSQILYTRRLPEKSSEIDDYDISYADSVITRYASDMYTKKGKRPGMLGENYRKDWVTEVSDIPYFDIEQEKGGLEIVKRGGGQQTKSLRLEGKDKKQYVLRSIEKYPASAVPADLRNTIAVDIVTDQISAANPYGAFTIPKLAEAAGIYHTNPKLVYLPSDPRLGIYQHTFGDGLFLFEERPAKDWSNKESFGNSRDIISTFDMLKEIRKDGDHYVDQEFALRSRLFDIFIGDWDRHDDQWRWATFKDEEGFEYYRPIPRDRDQAYFWSDGWLIKLASHNWGIAKFQGFHDKIRDVDGLSFNARHFDRSFINEPDRDDWTAVARDLQSRLTDDVIEEAIRDFPKEIYELRGEDIIRKLKNRRNDLVAYADEYATFLSKEVDVLGSDKMEHFDIERLGKYETRVTVYRLRSKDETVKRKVYERTFRFPETKEIRLYGFKGDDKFSFSGEPNKGMRIRIIGGKGDDEINDPSENHGLAKKIWVYDTKADTKITGSGNLRDLTSDKDPMINDYNRKHFNYNIVAPLLYPQYNPDDGIFIGAGVLIKTHGFRKDPYKSVHTIKANIAPKSRSYEFSYSGRFTDAIGKWNAVLNAHIFAPSYTDYFYGAGNETTIDKEKFENDHRYYSARYIQYIFYPELVRTSKNEKHQFLIGGGYQAVNVKSSLNDFDNEQERYVITYANSLDYKLLDVHRHYLALFGNYTYDNTNNKYMPVEGWRWNVYLSAFKDVDNQQLEVNFRRVRSDLSYYYSFGRFLRCTLALRVGGAATDGTYEFYHAAKSGGSTTFRGSRKFRYQGHHTFFQNTDLRIRLFNIRNPLVPTSVGITVFHDFGRVWEKDDPSTETGESDKLHRAYGGGVWIAPLNKISFGLDYSESTLDEHALYLRMGFFF